MTWRIRPGRWTVVVMNADGSRGVQALVRIGLKTNLFLWIGLVLLAARLLAGGAAAVRRRERPRPALLCPGRLSAKA
jgi:hypothetical protein